LNRFVIRRFLKNIFGTFNYDPEKYWLDRGKTLDKERLYDGIQFRIQEKILVDYLTKLNFSTVLELGYGFGRISKVILDSFPNIVNYTGIDISPHNQEKTKRYVKSDKANFMVSTIQDFISETKFDLVISVYVLMHVKPNDINKVLNKSISLSRKHVINMDWFQKSKPSVHLGQAFIHNYKPIYKENPIISDVNQFLVSGIKPPTTIFHAFINSKT